MIAKREEWMKVNREQWYWISAHPSAYPSVLEGFCPHCNTQLVPMSVLDPDSLEAITAAGIIDKSPWMTCANCPCIWQVQRLRERPQHIYITGQVIASCIFTLPGK